MSCFIDPVNDEKYYFEKALFDNLFREDLIPVDEAASYRRLYDESRQGSHNAKVEEIARKVKKSKSHIDNYLKLDELSDGVKKFLDPLLPKERRLMTSAAIDIAKSTDNPTLQLEIAKEAIERNLGLVEIRSLVSYKTGVKGRGIGGSERQPADEYKALKAFLGTTLIRVRRFAAMDLDSLYQSRPDEFGDRETDTRLFEELQGHIKDILGQVKEEES